MLIESLIKSAAELQCFSVTDVRKVDDGLEAQLAPDGRLSFPRKRVFQG